MKKILSFIGIIFCSQTMILASESADPVKVAILIDKRISSGWERAGIHPAKGIDDETFLRRVYLDLVGRIPTVSEARYFLSQKSSNKRGELVNQLMVTGSHNRHLATLLRRNWLPQVDTPEFSGLSDDFERWIVFRLQEKTPYNHMVLEILKSTVGFGQDAKAVRGELVTPIGFLKASESKPENLAANASRAFLGVNLDCAQCHDHPFARWTRDQFWQTAAFFAKPGINDSIKSYQPIILIPNTQKKVGPRLLDNSAAFFPKEFKEETGPFLLADWITSRNNPYFAKNAVNRIWAHIFGTGLVEPLDDLSGESGSSGDLADLLGQLADVFVSTGYDLDFMIKAFVLSRTYQLSTVAEGSPHEPKLIGRMPVRGLSGEQLYDSLRTASGLPLERDDTGRGLGLESRKKFASQFRIDSNVNAQRSITQALALMNGSTSSELSNPNKNPMLSGLIESPFIDSKGKIETLFLAVLARMPSHDQSKMFTDYLEGELFKNNYHKALGDIFWVLINSTEFNTNH